MATLGGGATPSACLFCEIARSSTSATLLHSDDRVVAFQDIKPAAFRHYLVIPVEHISTVNDLKRKPEDFSLVSHLYDVGKTLLRRDAPQSTHYRFGFHQPPLNSVNHLHLHCLALPFTPRWKSIKYFPLGPLGGFIEVEKLLQKLKPLSAETMFVILEDGYRFPWLFLLYRYALKNSDLIGLLMAFQYEQPI